MNNICPECGGRLVLLDNINNLSVVNDKPTIVYRTSIYGCKTCYRVFWGSPRDAIGVKVELQKTN